jgi:uncharacterized protein (DUF1015 family)
VAKIKPFRALRPIPELVSQVASPPYDEGEWGQVSQIPFDFHRRR